MTKKYYPRVLVVSNNSFSKTSSNGRTLGNLFIGWPKDRIAQFCVSTTTPDYEVCDNYYSVSDNEALRAFLHFRKARPCDIKSLSDSEGKTKIGNKRVYKTTFKEFVRELVWGCKRWNSKEWQKWVEEFSPELVVVFNSDSSFILSIATDVAKRYRIPIVLYNTEGYYFFKRSFYTKNGWLDRLVYPLYHGIYSRRFKKMMRFTKESIHLNDKLCEDYKREFDGNQSVLYSSSTINYTPLVEIPSSPVFTYIGNLGFKRYEPLIELANVLNGIDTKYRLRVYGNIPNAEAEQAIKTCGSIEYGGFLSYDDVQKVIANSTILFHVENQDPSLEQSLIYGFSTKIADSVSSGRPFLMFSSEDIAGAQYLLRNGIGWVAANVETLKQCIIQILKDDEKRQEVLNKAHIISERNHSNLNNRERFAAAIRRSLQK